jgi:SAM-dependent methyltransferase
VEPRYDTIGHGYARTRREDPRIREHIHAALGDARIVVNVGAGTGSYEPLDRHVIAIEPSHVMIAQRSRRLAPGVRAMAAALPLRDGAADAAMAILTIHHWDSDCERGVREMRRASRGRVVIVTYDPEVSSAMWLFADYLPEVAALDHATFPAPASIASWLGGDVAVEPIPIPRDCQDWMLGSFWAHPERVLDADARNATSGFARMAPDVVDRVVAEVGRDLASGAWHARHGALLELDECDVGLRLIVQRTTPS